ncbi:hypothetical protein, partial [Burkholderia cenocepacia]|uniref:hypothetical protein n=1 Tax=Burkholderia cenocepacia TaxID=95486 RepID=UPI001F45306A
PVCLHMYSRGRYVATAQTASSDRTRNKVDIIQSSRIGMATITGIAELNIQDVFLGLSVS